MMCSKATTVATTSHVTNKDWGQPVGMSGTRMDDEAPDNEWATWAMILFFQEGSQSEQTCELTALFILNFHEEVWNMNNSSVVRDWAQRHGYPVSPLYLAERRHIHMGTVLAPILTNA